MQILAEAAGRPVDQVGDLFAAMVDDDIFSASGLEVEFSENEARRMLEEFRQELPGIRRWLVELGVLPESGHA